MAVALAVAIVLAACSPEQTGEPRGRRPNVLLIVMDTTRADLLSAYGHWKPTTVHLERLAREGALFQRAFTTDFWTLPSHASLLTGLHPSDHQATSETNHLPQAALTLAEQLSPAGYRSAAFVANPWLGRERGFSQGFGHYTETWRPDPSSNAAADPDQRAVRGAIEWMRSVAAQGSPFFLFLNLNRVHLPHEPDAMVLVDLTPGARPIDRVVRLKQIDGGWGLLAGAETFDELDYQIMRELYEAEVAMLDAQIGDLVSALEAQGILDDTVVIVTSDHGENIGEHGLLDHVLSMYETTIRIPLIIRHPESFAPGTVDDRLVSIVDVYPTVLDVTGVERDSPDVKARSLRSPSRTPTGFVIAENERPVNGIELLRQAFPDFDTSEIDQPIRMLRTRRHKLIWKPSGDVLLFDLEADPEERRDVSQSEPEVRDALLAMLEAWMAEHGGAEQPTPFETGDPATLERLRALGYVE